MPVKLTGPLDPFQIKGVKPILNITVLPPFNEIATQ